MVLDSTDNIIYNKNKTFDGNADGITESDMALDTTSNGITRDVVDGIDKFQSH